MTGPSGKERRFVFKTDYASVPRGCSFVGRFAQTEKGKQNGGANSWAYVCFNPVTSFAECRLEKRPLGFDRSWTSTGKRASLRSIGRMESRSVRPASAVY